MIHIFLYFQIKNLILFLWLKLQPLFPPFESLSVYVIMLSNNSYQAFDIFWREGELFIGLVEAG